ncbi:MAG: TetR/AcrR family transcriptional regulator [Phycisphaerales bacterium JB063]
MPSVGSVAGDEPPTPKKPPTCLDESQVLDATARVLRERGYDGATIRAIARQLDCAVGSIYRYFPDKRALLDGVCQRRFASVADHAELRSGVRTSVLMYARVASEQPELYRLMFWLASVGKQQLSEAVPAVVRRVIAGWAESLNDQARAKALWAQLHGFIMLGLTPEQAVTMLDLPAPSRHAAAPASPAADTVNDYAAAPIALSQAARVADHAQSLEDLTLL